ncbi:MAG: L-rhamnose isomerase, partial [Bacteroidales bacterium]
MNTINEAFEIAKKRYAALGVDVDNALDKMANIQLSLHCWQTDDVCGFENPNGSLSG